MHQHSNSRGPRRRREKERVLEGLPWWHSGLESACQCRGHRFEPWSGRIPHATEQGAREPQLLSLHVWSLCSATGEAAIVRGPRTVIKSGPRLPQLEKALMQKRRPNTAIKKKQKKATCFLMALPSWSSANFFFFFQTSLLKYNCLTIVC